MDAQRTNKGPLLSEWLEQQQPSPNHLAPGDWRLCLSVRDRDELVVRVKALEAEVERLREYVRGADHTPGCASWELSGEEVPDENYESFLSDVAAACDCKPVLEGTS